MGLKKKLEKYNKNDLKNSNLNQDSENLEESRSPVSFYKKKIVYLYIIVNKLYIRLFSMFLFKLYAKLINYKKIKN